MAHIVSFHSKSTHPVTIIPKFGSVEIISLSFRFYLFDHNSSHTTPVVSCKSFSIFLTHQNSLNIRVMDSTKLLTSHLPLNTWNQVLITPDKIHVNTILTDFSHQINFREIRSLTLGCEGLSALIEIPQFNSAPELTNSSSHTEIITPGALGSIHEILLWHPIYQGNISRIPLRKMEKTSKKKLIVCHDHGDNYKLDIGHHDKSFSYRYFHWAHTDIFIYFSHQRLSIPPAGWTDTAHRNGTFCLGTFITEGDSGTEENKRFLENGEVFAMKLVEIMNYHDFDGYLINIESDVEDFNKLVAWVELLTILAHSARPESKIIWYDSVVKSGKIQWQSQLNNENLEFFHSCDGFFTDYHWKIGMPLQSAQLAGSRQWEVYTGTDIYGRGTYGGGEYNTRIGVNNSLDTSVALFAPGWTWEKAGHHEWESFLQAEKLLWTECSTPIIDSSGVISPNRPEINKFTLLQMWKIDILNGNSLENLELDWRNTNEKEKYWTVNNDLSVTSSFVFTKKSVNVDLKKFNKFAANYVTGSVEIKGTGPKFNDFYMVLLEAIDITGKVHVASKKGRTSEDWKTVSLEIHAKDIQFVTWSEVGKDEEYWQGFYGTSFRNTYVVVKEAGQSLLDHFEAKVHKEAICTWFSIGQGPKLYKKGEVCHDSLWNSLHDCGILPDFNFLKTSQYDFDHVYNGTTSLLLNNGKTLLFRTDFSTSGTNIKLVYSGDLKLLLENTEKISEESCGIWKIEYYKHSGHVHNIEVESTGKSYLAGVHFYQDLPDFSIEIVKHKCNWHKNSIESDLTIVNLEVQLQELPRFIRHLDIFHDGKFVSRAYSTHFIIKELIPKSQDLFLKIEAEDIKGDLASTVEILITAQEILKSSPVSLN